MTTTPETPTTRTLVVNLYGGPGTGKSTTAAATFALLKQQRINTELAGEYAKEAFWDGREYLLKDQLYIFAKQRRRIASLYGKVDVVVTDSPLYLSYHYSKNLHIMGLIQDEMPQADNLHVFLRRRKEYNPAGRYQTAEEARGIDDEIKQMLTKFELPYHEVDADVHAAEAILELVHQRRK